MGNQYTYRALLAGTIGLGALLMGLLAWYLAQLPNNRQPTSLLPAGIALALALLFFFCCLRLARQRGTKTAPTHPPTEAAPYQSFLAVALNVLDEGALACDREGNILVCNPAARHLFATPAPLVPNRSLYTFCAREPLEHTMGLLLHRPAASSAPDTVPRSNPFLCASVDGSRLFHCRMAAITAPDTGAPLLVITLADASRQARLPGLGDYSLRTALERLRAPMASLRAAAENLVAHPEMSPVMRSAFENVIAQESGTLTDCFESLVSDCQSLSALHDSLADIYSSDLFSLVAHRLAGRNGLTLNITGDPLWLRAESQTMMLLLEFFARRLQDCFELTTISCEALLGDKRVYLDLFWPGTPVPPATIAAWQQEKLPGSGNDLLVTDILIRHGSDVWSQEHRQPGWALLRIPVPGSAKQWHESLVAPATTTPPIEADHALS